MSIMLFVPMNDDLIEQYPGPLQERLVPYRTDLACFRGLASEQVASEVKHDRQEVRHVAAQ